MKDRKYSSFKDFYPFYLSQHQNKICRRLHVIGSLLVIVVLFIAIISKKYSFLFALPFIGYGFAWVGHFFFEKNRPATFSYPAYSFIGDWVMLWQFLSGKIKL